MRTKFICSTALVAIALSGHAFAQEAAEPEATAATEERSLDRVVVTAQRREQYLQDVPFTISSLSEDVLEEAAVSSIFDLKTVVSGIAWGGAGNLVQPAIRGVSTSVSTGGAENPNAFYIDGVYYSQPHLLGANLGDIERVEVLKGPQGTLFGRNSVGGAIRLFTKGPEFEPQADVALEVGTYTGTGLSQSNPRYSANGFVTGPLVGDTLAGSLSVGYETTDGWLTNIATGEAYGKVERFNTRGKLLLEPSEDISVLLNAYYLEHDDRGVQAMTPLNGETTAGLFPNSLVPVRPFHTAFDTTADGLDWDKADVSSTGISGVVEWDVGPGTLTSTTSHNVDKVVNFATLGHSVSDPDCLLAFACVDMNYRFRNEAQSQEFNYSTEQLGMFRFTGGLFYFNQRSELVNLANEIVFGVGVPLSDIRFDIESYAAYGEAEITPNDRWTLTVGGRYTHEPRDDINFVTGDVKEQTFDSFLPRVSVQYAVSDALKTYFTFAVGEKSGLSGVSNAGSIPPFQEVEPEENQSFEVGMKYAAADVAFNIAAFYYDYENKQEQEFNGVTTILQNTGPVEIFGIDADGTYNLTETLDLRGTLTWIPTAEYQDFQNAVGYTSDGVGGGTQLIFDASGERLIRAPEVTASIALNYERDLANGLFDASANYSYTSDSSQDILQVFKQDAYSLLGARLGFTPAGSTVRVGIYGRNLTNETYIQHAFGGGLGFTVNYARPREVGVALSANF